MPVSDISGFLLVFMPKISVRFTQEELDQVDRDARANHVDRSDWVRFCLLGDIPERRKPQPQIERVVRTTAVVLQEGMGILNGLMLLPLPESNANEVQRLMGVIRKLYRSVVNAAVTEVEDQR